MKRVKWDIEEMVAMVDLYYNCKNGCISDLNAELERLSKKLHRRADILKIQHDEKFRNLNGLKMIYENVRYVDTNGMRGLSCASQLAYDIVRLYNENNSDFRKILDGFNLKY